MPGPSCSLSRTQMRLSHLVESEPAQPGTIRRTGAPWISGRSWPFSLKAISVCSSIAFLMVMPREMVGLSVSPASVGSAP